MRRDKRFPVILSRTERRALDSLARDEALSAASVVRRLIIREAKERGLWPVAISAQDRRTETKELRHA